MDDLTTERGFDSQATRVIGVLRLYFDVLSISVCTIRHWHTTGRLVQKLNVCTVPSADHYRIAVIDRGLR